MLSEKLNGRVVRVNGRLLRIICVAFSSCFARYGYFTLPEGRAARAWLRYINWSRSAKIARLVGLDADACGVEEGDRFPWWTLGWWLFRPYLWLERIATVIPEEDLPICHTCGRHKHKEESFKGVIFILCPEMDRDKIAFTEPKDYRCGCCKGHRPLEDFIDAFAINFGSRPIPSSTRRTQ